MRPQVTCQFGGFHKAESERLSLAVARQSELIAVWLELVDAEARFRLGWPEDMLAQLPVLVDADPLVWDWTAVEFVGRDRRTGQAVANVGLRRHGDVVEVGGMVHADHRGLGYATEAMELVCLFAHQHLGVRELRAGCEVGNEASRRWLAACGFSPVDGPSTHTLPDGRVIASLWWQRIDPAARRRCRNLPYEDD